MAAALNVLVGEKLPKKLDSAGDIGPFPVLLVEDPYSPTNKQL